MEAGHVTLPPAINWQTNREGTEISPILLIRLPARIPKFLGIHCVPGLLLHSSVTSTRSSFYLHPSVLLRPSLEVFAVFLLAMPQQSPRPSLSSRAWNFITFPFTAIEYILPKVGLA